MPAQMTQTMKLMMNKHKQTPKLKEYPSYPHTSGRMGAMAIDCPIGVGVFVVVVACMCFWHRCVFFGMDMCVLMQGVVGS